MKTLAAVLVQPGRPLELAELEMPALRPGQVLVDIDRSGVCHTQLLEVRGRRGDDPWCPHCLGHEATGTVVETGPSVRKVRAGDRVVLTWLKSDGADVGGTQYGWGGRTVNAGLVTTFSRQAVVSESRVVPVPAATDGLLAVLLGCAVPTGFGAVFNVCAAARGSSLAVFGVGGVGLCALVGALAAGCEPVVAIDTNPAKLELARRAGAKFLLDGADADLAAKIREIVPGGLDFAIEATGRPAVMASAIQAVRPRGGAAVVIGNAPAGQSIMLDPKELNMGKRLLGTWGGDSVPDRDIPRFAAQLAGGASVLNELVSKSYPLAQINSALDDLEKGVVGRPVIDMGMD